MRIGDEETLIDTTAHLMNSMGKADQRFRDELVLSVVNICMAERYALVTDFVWYLSVLADLIRVPCSSHGALVGEQIIDVCLRVEVIREAAVGILAPLLLDTSLLEQSNVNKTVPSALKAVAWVVGEYAHCIVDHEEILDAMLNPAVKQLPGETQAVYLQAIFKVYASAVLAYSQGIRPTGAVGALPAPRWNRSSSSPTSTPEMTTPKTRPRPENSSQSRKISSVFVKRCRAASLRSPRASISKFASAVARCNRCSPSSAKPVVQSGLGRRHHRSLRHRAR